MPPQYSECVRRHRADWICHWFHRFVNGLEEPVPLNNMPTPYNPRSSGTIDPMTGILDPDNVGRGGTPGPSVFETFLPSEDKIGYAGELLIITRPEIAAYRALLERHPAHARVWSQYVSGNPYGIYRYVPSRGVVRVTTNASGNRLLQEVALAIGDLFPVPLAAVIERELAAIA